MRRPVVIVWAVGLLLALLLYLNQPEHLLAGLAAAFGQFGQHFDEWVASISHQTFLIVRALAIALFVVFVGLAVIAARRGLPARRMVLAVGFIDIVLLWRPFGDVITVRSWVFAFLVAALASLVMTRRLLAPMRGMPQVR